MWRTIATFEARYQARQPLVWLVTAFLAVLLFVAGSGEGAGGAAGKLLLNAPAVIVEQVMKGIPVVLFLATMLVASAALRDGEHGTAALFLSKPISRVDYLIGRFAGAIAVALVAAAIGMLALAAGTLMPGLDPARTGPFRFASHAYAFGVMVVPTVLSLGAIVFAIAIATRRAIATYVGAVTLIAGSAAVALIPSSVGVPGLGAMLDPFGVVALGHAVRFWTTPELNATVPPLDGWLLANRLAWLALGAAALAGAVATFDPSRHRARARRGGDHGDARATRAIDAASLRASDVASAAPTRRGGPAPRLMLTQYLHHARHETLGVLRGWPFAALLAFGLAVLLLAAADAGNVFGMPVEPRTALMVEALQGLFAIVVLLAAVLYAGELAWRDRARDVDGILDAMPVRSGVFVAAKLTALATVVIVMFVAGVVALVAFQCAQGFFAIEPGTYTRGIAVAAVYPLLIAMLAWCLQVLAPNRVVGYGLVIVFIVAWDVLEEFGFEHHLYRFASLPPMRFTEFDGYGPFALPFVAFALYWSCAAIVLVGVSVLAWRRGTDTGWRMRWQAARRRFVGVPRVAIVGGAIAFAGVGAWIFWNTNVVNAYVPTRAAEANAAAYERRYREHRLRDLPRVVAVRADVDIFPSSRRVVVRGTYELRNATSAPIRDVHVSMPHGVRVDRLALRAHDVVDDDATLGYRILRLRAPLLPGETTDLGFDVTLEQVGFVNHDTAFAVTDNGTYFTKRDVFPVIGYDEHRQLVDREARERLGLAPVLAAAARDDAVALHRTPRAPDADRIAFDVTVSTDADQIAVTSGALQREWRTGDRRHFRYVSAVPITHHFAFASARYAVTRGESHGVAIEVFHHPMHAANVGRMIDAAGKTLGHLSATIGPYPHRELRIVEFPRRVRDATAFPGMIAFSEALGFTARQGDDVAIDFPFYVTAHEVAHQWWGQQVVGADVEGVGALHESLAQDVALAMMAREVGRDRLRAVLAREHDWYLRGRAGERSAEPTLARAGREDYVYYHKGALAMHALRDAIGDARIDAALSRAFARFANAGAPYPTTLDLIAALRPVAPEHTAIIDDWFDRIVLYDLAIVDAVATAQADGRYRVRVDVSARKRRLDDTGVAHDLPIDDTIAFAFESGDDAATSTATRRERRLDAPTAAIEFIVDTLPARVVIDPDFHRVDRHRGDNTRDVAIVGRPE